MYQGCKDKEAALRSFSESRHLNLADICFMGDDVNDLGAIGIAGFPLLRQTRTRRFGPSSIM